MNPTFPTIALFSLVATPALSAQSTHVVPMQASDVEGSTSSVYPFGYTNPRCQQIWTGSSVTPSVSLISGLSLRMDTTNRKQAELARAYTNVTFAIGSTSMTPKTMSQTFANNVTSKPTVVISGNWNLPAQPAPSVSPAPFNIDFSFAAPYLYLASSGNLLLDITLPGSIGKSNYFVDAEYSDGVPGASAKFGTSGSFSTKESFELSSASSDLKPGGTFAVTCGTFNGSHTGNLVIGASKQNWGSATLPLDLAIINAANNYLYVSMDLQVGFSTTGAGTSHQSAFKAQIPNLPLYNGLMIHTQAYYTDDANANPLGLVTTHGLSVRVANPTAGPETNMIGNYDATKPDGNFAFGTRAGGNVVRFTTL